MRVFQRHNRLFRMLVPVSVMIMFFGFLTDWVVAESKMPGFSPDEGVYLMDPDTGDVYAKQHEDDRFYPASTTKLMTALVMVDTVGDRLDERVTVGDEIEKIDADSSLAEISAGDTYTWRELLYGLLLPSGNDAAMTIAVNVAKMKNPAVGDDPDEQVAYFAEMMNQKAKAIGADHSHFVNPHGLVTAEHYTTPKDMAKIAMEAFNHPIIAEVTATPKLTCQSGNGVPHEWLNSNFLIASSAEKFPDNIKLKLNISGDVNPYYSEYARSGKTGYDEAAGRCLVFSGVNGEMKLVGVIFNAEDSVTINQQAKNALDQAMTAYTRVDLTEKEDVYISKIILFDGFEDHLEFKLPLNTKGITPLTVPRDEVGSLNETIIWNNDYIEDHGRFLKVVKAFEAGEPVAVLKVKGTTYENIFPLYAAVSIQPFGWMDALIVSGVVLIIILLVVLIVFSVRRKKKSVGQKF